MNGKRIYAIVVISLLLLIGACSNMIDLGSGEALVQDGKALVHIMIGEAGSRTVLPEVELADVTTWKLLGGKSETENELVEFSTPENQDFYLETGTWNFTLNGYNSEDDLILQGKITDNLITLEGPNTLSFTVAPLAAGGSGTVMITINLPAGHGITAAKVFKDGSEDGGQSPITPDGDTVVFEGAYAAGNYFFSFQLYKDNDLYGTVSELVQVRANLVSKKNYTLAQADLDFRYSIIYYLDSGEFEIGVDSPGSYRYTDAEFTLPQPTRTGHTFGGWYADAGFSGEPVTAIPQLSTGDKEYWAKWAINSYVVSFDSQGGSTVGSQPIDHGAKVTKPEDPTRSNYQFGGWYKEAGCTTAWDFDEDTVTEIMTLYAKWNPSASIVVNPGGGSVVFGQTVTLTCDTEGALIYYTIDGGEPDSGSTPYTVPIPVTAAVTIKAIAYMEGMYLSTVLTVSYTVRAAAPVVESPAAGELHFGDDITITLSCATGGADIYYTLDGSEPSSSGTKYADAVPAIPKITGPVTLKAIAVKEGIDDSEVLTAEYTVDYTPPSWTFVTAAASTFGGSAIRGIAYGNGKYVAVGDGGKMAWSTNGAYWTAISPGNANDRSGNTTFGNTQINGITYADGKFVAGGVNGKMAYSPDGETWTAVTASQFGVLQITAIAYGNGKFVAVGGGGTIAYASSSDCQTWTKVVSPANPFPTGLIIWGITYSDGKFAAVGGGGNMIWSTDPTDWTAVTPGNTTFGSSIIRGITYGDGKFVAAGDGGKMAWSTDLTNWTAVTPGDTSDPGDTTFGSSTINGITYGGGQFIAVGARVSDPETGMAASPDGKTWIRVSSLIAVPNIWGIVYGGGKFVAVAGVGVMAWSNDQE